MITCATMANVSGSKRVIEVACGPGKHSIVLATSFLNRDGGVLVSCDYSGVMVEQLKANYNSEHDYGLVKGNKYFIED